jgi:hypothetical protein
LAIMVYENAKADPASANWEGVADLLRLAIPAGRTKLVDVVSDSPFAPFADYEIPHNASGKRLGKSPVVIVTFADGETVRVPAVSLPGKPVNIGRALRVARAYYQGRVVASCNGYADEFGFSRISITDSEFCNALPIPAVASCTCETSGASYEPAQCSETISTARPA